MVRLGCFVDKAVRTCWWLGCDEVGGGGGEVFKGARFYFLGGTFFVDIPLLIYL